MTRVLIIADMEGVTGITQVEECRLQAPGYERGVRLLATEVNEIAASAREAGASSVSVIDWHAGGGNLKPELLADGVEIVPEDLSVGYDVVLLTGFHAMAGTPDAFISHTMSQAVTLEMNGDHAGELALLSRWAGDNGIPVALAAGDRAAMREAATFLPGTPTFTTKDAISWERATPVDAAQVYPELRAAVRDALLNSQGWQTYRTQSPVNFRIKLNPEPPMAAKIPWVTRDDDGWLTGQVQNAKEVIDLIDVFTALR